MSKQVLRFPCPCCERFVEVDVRTGKARPFKPTDAKERADLERMLAEQSADQERIADLFEQARAEHDQQATRLDDLFRKAFEDAERDPNEKPRHPFELE